MVQSLKTIKKKGMSVRYFYSQLDPDKPLCTGKCDYGDLELVGPRSIAAKACKKCTHLLYKEDIAKRREEIRNRLIKAKSIPYDLFHF